MYKVKFFNQMIFNEHTRKVSKISKQLQIKLFKTGKSIKHFLNKDNSMHR